MPSESPSDDWFYRYSQFGTPDHIQALGCVAVTFNALESQLLEFLHPYLGKSIEISRRIFASLTNNQRLDIARRSVDSLVAVLEDKEGYKHFINGFDICAENRNYLMHAVGNVSFVGDKIYTYLKYSRSDPNKLIYYPLSAQNLREIADANLSFIQFYEQINDWVHVWRDVDKDQRSEGMPSAFPQKPPIPRKLSLICREALGDEKYQLRTFPPLLQEDD